MRGSTERILTTHVGALPIPPGLWGRQGVEEERLRLEVAHVVRLQREAGVDIVNEGELTKGGNWVSFINQRFTGFVPVDKGASSALLKRFSKDTESFLFALADAIGIPMGLEGYRRYCWLRTEALNHALRKVPRSVSHATTTDCGLGSRCHPQVAWAKLKALSEGAASASNVLWSRTVAT